MPQMVGTMVELLFPLTLMESSLKGHYKVVESEVCTQSARFHLFPSRNGFVAHIFTVPSQFCVSVVLFRIFLHIMLPADVVVSKFCEIFQAFVKHLRTPCPLNETCYPGMISWVLNLFKHWAEVFPPTHHLVLICI